MAKSNYTKIKTPVGRVAFPKVFTPAPGMSGGAPKYKLDLIFDKKARESAEYKSMISTVRKIMVDKFGADQKSWPKTWKNPIRKCADRDSYSNQAEGDTFIGISCNPDKSKPQVLDRKSGRLLVTADDFYSGCFAQVTAAVGWYEVEGNKGVHFLLNNVLKTDDGERMDNKKSAFDDFGVDPGAATDDLGSGESQAEDGLDF